MNLEKLRECIKAERYELRIHAVEQSIERSIPIQAIIEVVMEGEIVEDYPDDKYFSSCLMFKMVVNRPIHVVAALDENESKVYIITNYEPNLEKFEPDYKTRRRK